MPQTVAIVTGGSGGIGRAVSIRLAAGGLAVIVNYSGNKEAADKVVAEIGAAGGSARAVKADMSSVSEVRALFDAAEQAFGGVDVVVNSAGIMKTGPLPESSDEDYESTLRST